MTVGVEVIVDRKASLFLDRLSVAISGPSLLSFLGGPATQYLQERAKARFANEGDDASGKWYALRQATIDIRTGGQVNYGAGPINHRTGALERYITGGPTGTTASPSSARLTLPKLPGGKLRKKLEVAQRGLPFPSTPPRPVAVINEADAGALTTSLQEFIIRAGS